MSARVKKSDRNSDEDVAGNKSITLRPEPGTIDSYSRNLVKQVSVWSGNARMALNPENRDQYKKYGIAAFIAACILAPIVSWTSYQSSHIVSTNAVVRGHVTEIGTRLKGIVTEVEYRAGDRVTAGATLAKLEDSHIRAEALEAQAVLAGLEQQFEVELLEIELEKKQIDEQLTTAKAKLSAAEAEAIAARVRAREAERAATVRRELFAESGAISGEAVQDAESERREAAALLQASVADQSVAASERNKTALALDAVSIRERRIGILEAEIQQAQARVKKIEADLAGANIRAPSNGAILRRIVEPGGSVDAGQPIITMQIGSDVWIEAWIDEKDLPDIAIGSPTTVTLQSFPDQEFAGKVTSVGLSTDFEIPDLDIPQPRFARMRGTPVVGVRIQLDNPPTQLVPGLSATVAILRNDS